MATSPQTVSLVAGSLGLFLGLLLTTPALRSIAARFILGRRQRTGYQHAQELYEDQDGVATQESVKAFSDKRQRIAIAGLSAVGFVVSLALATITTNSPWRTQLVEHWLQVGVWVCNVIDTRY